MVTSTTVGAPGSLRRYFHSLWLLSGRDLRVRYTTSALGYLWSILDPLIMTIIFWFVFTQIFKRVGEEPYIVYLMAAMLPWMWFSSSINDFANAFNKDARLVRSTMIPRTIWVNRVTLTKGIIFLLSLPVLAIFAILNQAHVNWMIVWFPVGVLLQVVLLTGLGLILAPLCVLYVDLERTTALILRALLYVSGVIYGIDNLPDGFGWLPMVNPLFGIFSLYRVGFFPNQWHTLSILSSAMISFAVLAVGLLVFPRFERAVLKEL